jgi:putative ABC transport system permease protein
MFLKKLFLLLPWSAKGNRESSLEEELQSHIELAANDALTEGLTPEEATFAARRDLGSVLRIQEEARDVWGFVAWDRFQRDCVYSIRTLRRARSFTVVAILSLGVGIGSATAIFSLVNTVLLKPLSYRQPGQLVNIREVVAPLTNTYPSLPVNYQHFLFWREHARSFESLAAVQGGMVDLTGAEPIKVDSATVTTNLFSLLGVQPRIGRSFLREEGQKGHDSVVIITDSLWNRRFGRAPDLVGKTLMLDYVPHTVVGILPADFRFPKNSDLGPLVTLGKNTELFMPLSGSYSDGWGGDYDYAVFGRLNPKASMPQAIAELELLERQIDAEQHLGEGLRVVCSRLQDVISTPIRTPLYVLMAAVLLLLLIVCVNLANLVLARSSARAREFSIRTALGAARTRLIQQVLIETLFLGVAGGALGLLLAILAVHSFTANTAVQIPRLDEVQIDARVFLFSLFVSLACGLLSGLLPAWRMTKVDNQGSLSSGSHTLTANRQSLRVREILIGSEVAISVVLLFGAGLMTASLARLLSMDKGFTAEQAVAVDIGLPFTHYKTEADYIRFWDQALERLHSIPGAQSVAYASKLPLTGESNVNGITLDGVDQEALDPISRKQVEINVRFVSPEYFRTMGIPLLQGRALQPVDRHRDVAVVSARLAAKLWPGRNPLGKKFSTGSKVGKAEVVGVVKDVHATTLDQEPTLMVYVPYWRRNFGYGSLVIRSARDPASLIPSIRKYIQALDPSLPPPQTRTIARLVSDSLSRRYFQVRLSSGFAIAALALALIGIYGVVAYSVAQRRAEIAIRVALGASRAAVVRLVLQRGLRPVLVGLIAGLIGAAGAAQLIRSLLFGVTAADPLTILGVIVLLVTAAFCACALPARRASRTDPAIALRYE